MYCAQTLENSRRERWGSNHAMAPNVPFEPELVFSPQPWNEYAGAAQFWGVYLAMKTIESHTFRCLDTLSLLQFCPLKQPDVWHLYSNWFFFLKGILAVLDMDWGCRDLTRETLIYLLSCKYTCTYILFNEMIMKAFLFQFYVTKERL